MQHVEGIPSIPMILLKRHISRMRADGKRRLSSFLLTFYGRSMAAQGWAAVTMDGLKQLQSMAPSLSTDQSERINSLCQTASLLLKEIQNLSEAIGDLESFLSEETG